MLKEWLIYVSKFVSLMESVCKHMSLLRYPQLLIFRYTHLHSLSPSLPSLSEFKEFIPSFCLFCYLLQTSLRSYSTLFRDLAKD